RYALRDVDPKLIVIDELDRLEDDDTISLLADTIKTLSDHSIPGTLMLVGEVTGPPGTPGQAGSGSGIPTGAAEHASSVCAFNGLNDFNLGQGQLDFIVQTPANQGVPGQAGADAAGSG